MLPDFAERNTLFGVISKELEPELGDARLTSTGITYPSDEVPSLSRDGRWDFQVDLGDPFICSCWSSFRVVQGAIDLGNKRTVVTGQVLKRWVTNDELVHEYTEGPKIDLLIVFPTLHHLRRQVIQGTAERRPAVSRGMHAPAEVTDLQLAVDTEQNVLWFDITVDDMLRVEI